MFAKHCPIFLEQIFSSRNCKVPLGTSRSGKQRAWWWTVVKLTVAELQMGQLSSLLCFISAYVCSPRTRCPGRREEEDCQILLYERFRYCILIQFLEQLTERCLANVLLSPSSSASSKILRRCLLVIGSCLMKGQGSTVVSWLSSTDSTCSRIRWLTTVAVLSY